MADQGVEVRGLDELERKFGQMKHVLRSNIEAAGKEAADVILDSEGLRNYPSETAANQPPSPYYIRGRGTQYKNKNLGNSEKYGASWNTVASGYKTTIGNTASYSKWVGGEEQAKAMARIGWKKLKDVAEDKRARLSQIYEAWVERAKKMAGL